ncbi:unnamed protein product [Closterium sp. Yama58-4]|nr:unnamed protein product [Closterium sp. Yama58-4]
MSPMAVLRLPTEHPTALSLHDFYDASPAAAGGIVSTRTCTSSLPSTFFNSAILQSHGLRCDHAHGSHNLSPDLARWYQSSAPVAQSSPAPQYVASQPTGLPTTRNGAEDASASAAPTPAGPREYLHRSPAAGNAVRAVRPPYRPGTSRQAAPRHRDADLALPAAVPAAKRARVSDTRCVGVAMAMASQESTASPLLDLPSDILRVIMDKVVSRAHFPAQIGNVMLSCRALRALCWSQQALAAVSPAVLHIRASQWSPRANRFLSACAAAGNAPAAYFLGMITFYSFGNYAEGLKLLAKAALAGHAAAMYALSVVHFNGSGMAQAQRNLPVALALCARAASLGHTPAMRELGYCLHDGYGLPRDAAQAQQLLLEAEALETAEKARVDGVVQGGSKPAEVRGGDGVDGSRLEQGVEGREEQGEEDREEQEEEGSAAQEEADMIFAREILQSGELQSVLTKAEGCGDVAPAESSQESAAAEAAPAGAAATEAEAGAGADAEAASVDPAARVSAPSTDATTTDNITDMHSLDSKEWEPSSPSLAELMELQEDESCRPTDPAHFFLLEWQKLNGIVSNTHSIHIPALPSHGVAAAFDLSPTAPAAPAATGTSPVLHACSNPQCGRQETREHEFRCCAACTEAKYCSRACQAADWVGGHRVACTMLGAALAAMTQGARF